MSDEEATMGVRWSDLTRAQRDALKLLTANRCVWPAGRGRFRISGGPTASERVLSVLSALGLAKYVYTPGIGVLPSYRVTPAGRALTVAHGRNVTIHPYPAVD